LRGMTGIFISLRGACRTRRSALAGMPGATSRRVSSVPTLGISYAVAGNA
jgi:hypothetical protein